MVLCLIERGKNFGFLAEKKVLQKFYKNSKNLEFFQKKVFSYFLMFFHILRSKMRYLSTYADYLKYFETFFSMNILLKHLTDVFEFSITFWNF